MARTSGARNQDFEERRLALAQALRIRLAQRTGKRPSYADLAEAAGVSLATLRHYFGSRDQAVAAVLSEHARLGDPHLAALSLALPEFEPSIAQAAKAVAEGLDQPLVAELHAIGMAEGTGHPTTGPAYLAALLEPLVRAVEQRLGQHISLGQMRDVDPRAAALSLISPLVVVHLHQTWLGGDRTRPLDKARHLEHQIAAFVRAYAAGPSA